ncbi:ATP-binding protein [Constantimarinum furrinae]|uniref:histidine kinase n=1 Tax=Constantimarinum furrinae TaxID=2562285 RepID=A0A7G8PWE8_9FLAO|nr:ATP-binding protein [Constantimarinum furrinae]QNJ98664.1 Histidine kinase response regulator hybrid protein [Constantimarinum furrinae]
MSLLIPRRFYWISVMIFLVMSLLCTFLFLRARDNLQKVYYNQIKTSGSLASHDFERTIRNNIISLSNLKARLEESDGAFQQYLFSDAERLIGQNEALQFVEWINKDGIITDIVPLEPNKTVIGLDISKIEYRYTNWREKSLSGITNITPWVKLTQGGKAFLVDVPVFYKEEFQGTITAGMDFKKQFDNIGRNLEEHAILIKDDVGNVFYSFNDPQPANFPDSRVFTTQLKPNPASNENWTFYFLYRDNAVYKERTRVQNSALGVGLIFSALLSLLSYFFLAARFKAKKFESLNFSLNQLNNELELEKEKAFKASQAKTQFLSNMSHEIRTPLNAILGFANILKDRDISKTEGVYVKLMHNSANALLSLVNDILDIDKIESGEIKIDHDEFSPSKRIKKIVDTYTPEIYNKGLVVETNIEAVYKKKVIGDRSKFDQIFTNLINNAIKFTPEGRIKVHYSDEIQDGNLIVTVFIEDTGVGISQSKLDYIYDRFVQAEDGIRKRHAGGGLGLSITKELVSLLDGTIEVESKENEGTKFTVTLPFLLSSGTITDENNDLDFTGTKALVVDDNRLNRIILMNYLNAIHVKSVGAANGKEALRCLEMEDFDLILMDIHMPQMDGFETVSHIRSGMIETLIIGVSADVTRQAIEKGMRVGMDDYLLKPINKSDLYAILQKHFRHNKV